MNSADLAASFLGEEHVLVLCEAQIDEILEYWHPLDGFCWDCRAIDEREVFAIAAAGSSETASWQQMVDSRADPNFDARSWHIERIATLMGDGNLMPIVLEVFEGGETLMVSDGNHRLAAQIITGQEHTRFFLRECELEDARLILPSLTLCSPDPEAPEP